MGGAQVLIAHAAKVVILVALVGLAATGRYRRCWSLTGYLVVALVAICMISFWPERFYNYHFYAARQAAFDVFKLLIALEISHKVFAAFPGAMSRWRAIAFVVLAVTTCAVILSTGNDPVLYVAYHWQPRIVAGAIWMLCAIALLVAWHRLPIDAWHHAILAGYIPYLVVFTTIMNMIPRHWSAFEAFGLADDTAYLMLVSWWAYAAWRPEERRVPAGAPVPARLVMEPTP